MRKHEKLKQSQTVEIKQQTFKQLMEKEEIAKEIRKCLEINENKNTTYQNLCEMAKVVLRGRFIAINAYI